MDKTIAVSVNQAGEPVKFSWQGATYAVLAKSVRWFARKQWWAEANHVQRGIGAGVLEVEMWRVKAANESHETGMFEIMHRTDSKHAWHLVRIYHS